MIIITTTYYGDIYLNEHKMILAKFLEEAGVEEADQTNVL